MVSETEVAVNPEVSAEPIQFSGENVYGKLSVENLPNGKVEVTVTGGVASESADYVTPTAVGKDSGLLNADWYKVMRQTAREAGKKTSIAKQWVDYATEKILVLQEALKQVENNPAVTENIQAQISEIVSTTEKKYGDVFSV